jgi:hypothetical protein
MAGPRGCFSWQDVGMKYLVMILLITIGFKAEASSAIICPMLHLKRVVRIAEAHSGYDKNLHCSISCMLSLKCPAQEVLTIGVLKEIKDIFGPGEADFKDMQANLVGVQLVLRGRARSAQSCMDGCNNYYPPEKRSWHK